MLNNEITRSWSVAPGSRGHKTGCQPITDRQIPRGPNCFLEEWGKTQTPPPCEAHTHGIGVGFELCRFQAAKLQATAPPPHLHACKNICK